MGMVYKLIQWDGGMGRVYKLMNCAARWGGGTI